ncbi:riboflavin synthase [Aeromicrobium sp. 636]|uniref:Riboflavin synthase n=1 Tax=Aeromicrobium senzhongii TaxID=2663859 RepID=A0A8I0ETE6_9ACTN|nr:MULTISPECIES: riboflavin synthase [Aeromicrobium]MBC9225214.1 riboflavin synthase [Aeromicrobium senzhongii]MCQ3997324.1 riboflavin synthase [Aeromicrobium sp. 636]MTB87261.1 riboflavin synthase [Aeromicrobium senzhongii]QNL95670.1 riboflavin synthase [Aeromicrobium senzhongii]
MFTGLVEEKGTVVALDDLGDSVRITIRGPVVTSDAAHGDSIAVNGCCLTVVDPTQDTFSADVMRESLDRTSLGDLTPGAEVNLERAMQAGARMGGHIVQGHVDGTATLLDRTPSEHWEVVRFSLPPELARYVVDKGSITVDGTSLTVVEAGDDWFSVSLIPTTLADTVLGTRQPGDRVNLEVDVIAKYVERLLEKGAHA